MRVTSFIKPGPVEMIASERKLNVPLCVEAMVGIAVEKFNFSAKVADNFMIFDKGETRVCLLAFVEKGLVVLDRRICPDFIILLRLGVATMKELKLDEKNDFEELQDILGQKIEFSDAVEEDTEDVTPYDPEEASLEAIKQIFKNCATGKDVKESSQDPLEEEESESDWI